jgi:hypothetical protein
MRKIISTLFIVADLTCFAYATQPIPVQTQYLKKIIPSTSFFNGKVRPVKTGKFGTLNPGTLAYTASPGDIVYSQIKNEKGEVVRPGTPIIIQDTALPKLAVETARINLLKAKRTLLNKENEYKRYYGLNSKHKNLISQKQIQETKADFDTAELIVKNSESELKKAEINLEKCTVYPEFTGQVDEVYYSPGTSLDKFKDIVKVTMMNPMAVDLILPLGLINHLGIENKILVYDAENEDPKEALLCKDPINPSEVSLLVPNELIPSSELLPEQKKLPVVHKVLFAIDAYITKQSFIPGIKGISPPVAIPVNSIKKDSKGHYVWQAVNQRVLSDKQVKTQFHVKKVYITRGDIIRHISFIKGYGNNYCSIKEKDKILPGDLLIVEVPDGLKDGDEVVYQQLNWRYTINETVKVTISETNNPGFYVPYTTIFNQHLGTPQVCIAKDNKAMFVNVKQSGLHGEYIRIENDMLKEGNHVVIDTNNALQNVYDGAPLKIIKVIEPLKKLSHNVAKAYKPVTAPTQPAKE